MNYRSTIIGKVFREEDGVGTWPIIMAVFKKFVLIEDGQEIDLLADDGLGLGDDDNFDNGLQKEIDTAVWSVEFPKNRFIIELYSDIKIHNSNYVFRDNERIFFSVRNPTDNTGHTYQGIIFSCVSDDITDTNFNVDRLIEFTNFLKKLKRQGRIGCTECTMINEYTN